MVSIADFEQVNAGWEMTYFVLHVPQIISSSQYTLGEYVIYTPYTWNWNWVRK